MKSTKTGVYHGKSTIRHSAQDSKVKSECDRQAEQFLKAALDGLNQGAKESELTQTARAESRLATSA